MTNRQQGIVVLILCLTPAVTTLAFHMKRIWVDEVIEYTIAQYPIGWRYLREAGVEPNDIEDCYYWALGEQWYEVKWNMTADKFRSLHPEVEPPVRDSDCFEEAWIRIGKLYLEAKP